MEIAKLIEERELENWHIVTATIIGMFAQLSGLNQGIINIVTRRVGEKIAEFYTAKGQLPLNVPGGPREEFKKMVEFVNDEFKLCSDLTANTQSENVELRIKANKCRICPKGVGHAELQGTACPFPGLFEAISEGIMGDAKFKLVRTAGVTLKKVDDYCIIQYSN